MSPKKGGPTHRGWHGPMGLITKLLGAGPSFLTDLAATTLTCEDRDTRDKGLLINLMIEPLQLGVMRRLRE